MSRLTTALIIAFVCLGGLLPAQNRAPIMIEERAVRELAIQRSVQVTQSRLGYEIEAERFRLGIRSFLPTASLSISSSQTVVSGGPDSTVASVELSILQPIYNGGRIQGQRDVNRAQLELAGLQRLATREQVGDQAWTAFQRALLAALERDLREETFSLGQEQLVIAEREQELGLIREIDLLETELSVADLEISLQEADSAAERAQFDLRRALSLAPDQPVVIEGKLDTSYAGLDLGGLADRLVTIAVTRNLELLQEAAARTQAEQQLRLARNWWQPSISANLTIGASGSQLPLQQPRIEGGLQIQFLAPELPSTVEVTRSSPSESSRTESGSAQIGVVRAVESVLSLRQASLVREGAQNRYVRSREALAFGIAELVDNHQRQRRRVELLRDRAQIISRRIAILNTQLDAGQITRRELIQAQIEQNGAAISLAQEVLVLIELERQIERNVGLSFGDLQRVRDGAL
jgi:outer membrane protein TolC